MSVQKGREGREGKKRRLRNSLPPPPIPQLGFYGRENAHRGSTDEWNFNEIFASAIGYLGERGRRSLSLCLSLFLFLLALETIHREGFDSIGRLYSQFLDEPWPWKIGNGRGVLDTVFPDANHICLLFREEKRREGREIEASSIWKIMKRYFDCVLSLVEAVGEAGQFYRRNRTVNLNRINLE